LPIRPGIRDPVLIDFFTFGCELFHILAGFEPFVAVPKFGLLEETINSITGLSANAQPVEAAVILQHDRGRFRPRVIVTNNFQETTVSRFFLISHHNAVASLIPGSNPA
jgi:hypothetical protein